MTMPEVCARLCFTKKAVRYYIGEGLIAPRRLENGYADFSEADCEMLEHVALLRRPDCRSAKSASFSRSEAPRPLSTA